MMRRKLVAGNWKMNGSRSALAELTTIAAAADAASAVDVSIALPATLIAPAVALVPGFAIGGQDVHAAESGAHTGCLSASMLVEAGARFTIVGHSERRTDQGETSQDAWAKASAAHRHGLSVILCVGETDAERDAGRAARVVQAQIEKSVPDLANGDWLTIAYEPRWAIGTGRTTRSPKSIRLRAPSCGRWSGMRRTGSASFTAGRSRVRMPPRFSRPRTSMAHWSAVPV